VWSAVRPHDYFTWALEVAPALLAAVVLVLTYPRFRFTMLAYWLIAIHATILLIGGHYTYALVPLGEWLRSAFDLGRNHYDRVGHFAQGFVPAIIAREILVRCSPLKEGSWLRFLVLCVCLAISATYELFEWRVAVLTGSMSDDFLGTQGDPWDTQKDMATALIGAVTALLFLSHWHDRQLSALREAEAKEAAAGALAGR
jgi:putative membrane protein